MKTKNQLQAYGITGLLSLIISLVYPSAGLAQYSLKMSQQDMAKVANTAITVDDMSQKTVPMTLGGQAFVSTPGKYGMMFLNAPVYKAYVERLEDNIDVMISTLNEAYPQRKALIDKLLAVAGGLTYEYHMAVGTQTGQPKSMSQAGREKFMKSITTSLNLDFYTDDFLSLNDDYRNYFFQNRLSSAATASGEVSITQYNPNMTYMASQGSDPSRGKDRIRDTAKDCVALVLSEVKKNESLGAVSQAVSSAIDVVGSVVSTGSVANSAQVNTLFKTFTRIKSGSYWQLTKPGSVIGFYLKLLPGATLASDVTNKDGTGDRYVDEYALKNGIPPFPSPYALNLAKSVSNDFSGVGVVTVPGGTNGVIVVQPGSSSGNTSNGQSSGTPAPPTPIH
ncbi:hypothetical protein [Spirosoma foliorum]|uniref:Uncharacterized protein n=1 Tax=Spirosoma foliorum TaxID=2710596 RepID=A0A7G5GVI1_9BACT|nr:hypothetical protein [Spirosoma foliorum]QMW02873.1 hypothetical protein H3H32_34110 [Spirosoma foliorum]